MSFGAAEGHRLAEIRMTAIEDRLAAELNADGPGVVVPELERLLPDHPYREELWSLLIRALYRGGRQADALSAFDRARHALMDGLGIEPGRELRELHAQVLRQDPALDPVARACPLPASMVATHPMIGRESELAWLTALWQQARSGSAVTAMIRGAQGAGATRLAQELAANAAKRGAAVRLAGDPAPADLIIADRVFVPVPAAGQLVVALGNPTDPAPAGAAMLDLPPLSDDAVRAIVAGYATLDEADRATADVLAASGGWPGAVHRSAAQWRQRAVAERVRAANESVARSAGTLTAARAELIDGVLALSEHPPAVLPIRAGVRGRAWRPTTWPTRGSSPGGNG